MVDWAWSIQSVIQAKRSSNAARGIWSGGSLARGEARLEPSARGPPCPLVGEGAAQRRCACAVLRARVGRRARRRDTRVGPARADGFTLRECAAAGSAHERPVGMAGAGKQRDEAKTHVQARANAHASHHGRMPRTRALAASAHARATGHPCVWVRPSQCKQFANVACISNGGEARDWKREQLWQTVRGLVPAAVPRERMICRPRAR